MTTYNSDICLKIFTELASTPKGLDRICRENGVSTPKFREFILRDTDAGNNYAHARSMQIELFENQITELTYQMAEAIRDNTYDPLMVNAAVQALRVQVDSLKWVLSKIAPKKYGDKLDVTSNGKALPTSINIVLDNGGYTAISETANGLQLPRGRDNE